VTKERSAQILHAPYFEHPDIEAAEELIRACRSQTATNLGNGTILLSLIEAHPEQGWATRYQFYVDRARRYKEEYPLNGVGWNDYHMCRWMILGTDEDLIEVMARYTWGGQVGDTARWMVDSMMKQCPAFAASVSAFRTANEEPSSAGGKE
jgi:hypothetical protein